MRNLIHIIALLLLPTIASAAPAQAPDVEVTTISVEEAEAVPELRPLFFETNRAWLDTHALNDAEYDLQVLRDRPDLNVILVGNTDAVGRSAYNDDLSARRASAVASFLEDNGISPDRLLVLAAGDTFPRVATTSASAANRRVDLVATSDGPVFYETFDEWVEPM